MQIEKKVNNTKSQNIQLLLIIAHTAEDIRRIDQ
jgi:hypothetical protein